MKARDIMTVNVISVKRDALIKDIAHILVENRIGGVPVVDDDGRVVGIISETDLVRKEKNVHIPSYITVLQGVIYLESFKRFEEDIRKITAYKAEDIMTAEVEKVHEDDDVETIASLMIEKGVNRVPVVDSEGKLKGIICRYDIIKSMFN
ncbi:MAG: CBS domain-containing protein [Peptoclostridium sp.]|uniref:CBS domain-containing protein n=1 Tax=Peptoclostridium sp. TaxID=1904860 RepID=UPI00139E35C0|nr:CBS domain-containing protein [Peptoclostridium sp.]MZQ75931.1 CBS domain-containing protein [Peptoclostridium sp.]